MKSQTLSLLLFLFASQVAWGQDYQIKTLFKSPENRASGGYGAAVNKLTTINGQFVNIVEVYGGWYINHRFLLGAGGASLTNNLPVAEEFSVSPGENMSYQYVQFGLMLEYTLWSHRAVHFAIHSFNGPGLTVQYRRFGWEDDDYWNDFEDHPHDPNWFFVTEPGVKVEFNLFKWMRLSPGISYRAVFNSRAPGLSDKALSGTSVNLALKFGKF